MMIEATDPSLIAIVTGVGVSIGLILKIISLNAHLKAKGAQEQKILGAISELQAHFERIESSHDDLIMQLKEIQAAMHNLQIQNQQEHHALSERLTRIEANHNALLPRG